MNESPSSPVCAADDQPAPTVVELRDHLTQTLAAVNQLRSILIPVDDPGRRFGQHQ